MVVVSVNFLLNVLRVHKTLNENASRIDCIEIDWMNDCVDQHKLNGICFRSCCDYIINITFFFDTGDTSEGSDMKRLVDIW